MKIISCSLLIIWMAVSGCAVKEGAVYEKDGKYYGRVDGLFKEKWNDYYLRGLSYAEGSFWEDASADFRQAIMQRDEDQRRARTYGLHFIDYFPNRELGIAFFNLGLLQEAIQALKASLASVETARAKFYLNKARQLWLKESGLDTLAPSMAVQFPPGDYRTNEFFINVKATARDNFFVSEIIFNAKPFLLELASPETLFEEEFLLGQGENFITLQAHDLVANASEIITIRVLVDREGPLVLLEGEKDRMGNLLVSGAVYDDSSIAKVTLNNQELLCRKEKLLLIKEKLTMESLVGEHKIRFIAEDQIGNKTSGAVAVLLPQSFMQPETMTRIAFQNADVWPGLLPLTLPMPDPQARAAVTSSEAAATRANIKLKTLRDGQVTFLETLFIEGSAFAPAGIKDLTVNGESFFAKEKDETLAAFLKELLQKKKRTLAFSRLVQLREGPNTITVKLEDADGRVVSKTLQIVRNIPKVRQIGSRLSVSIYPFKEKTQGGETIAEYVQTFLTHAFVNQHRFNVLERQELNKILTEQQMSQEALFDQQTAIQLGRLMASETILLGDIYAGSESVEVVARMVDTQTSLILAEKDVYWEGKVRADFRNSLAGLALKFKQHFPLCEGEIIDKKLQDIFFNLGRKNAISQGMRMLAFQETGPVAGPEAGTWLGTDTEILGLLCTREVHEQFSKADILKKFTAKDIKVQDKVITK